MTTITSRIRVAGLHHWPEAPKIRDYLREPHRHLFVITATVGVAHTDRDVEFHDLQDAITVAVESVARPRGMLLDFGAASCETIALNVLTRLRSVCDARACSVSEDGENHATVTVEDLTP